MWQIVETVPHSSRLSITSPACAATLAISQLLATAKQSIDIEMFYFRVNTNFTQTVLQTLLKKAHLGIKIRIIVDASPIKRIPKIFYPAVIKKLLDYPNVTILYNNYFNLRSGIMHAKLVIVDQNTFYLGSHNFDWIAFEQNHELGIIIQNAEMASLLTNIFNFDFYNNPIQAVSVTKNSMFIATSPPTSMIANELEHILELINNAKISLNLVIMEISNLDQYTNPPKYWDQIQVALTAAIHRNVQVQILVSGIEFKPGISNHANNKLLLTLQKFDNVSVKYIIYPKTERFWCTKNSAIEHAKFMVTDKKNSWIGTGNLSYNYFANSRNYSVFALENQDVANCLNEIFTKLWHSEYAHNYNSHIILYENTFLSSWKVISHS